MMIIIIIILSIISGSIEILDKVPSLPPLGEAPAGVAVDVVAADEVGTPDPDPKHLSKLELPI